MSRYDQRSLKGSFLIVVIFALCFGAGLAMIYGHDQSPMRIPASDIAEVDLLKAPLSVSIQEFQDSKPTVGRSYFDKIFSVDGRYQIPYPFNKVLARLSEYSGQKINNPDGTGIKVAIIPMGRSLQRNAALDEGRLLSVDQFFRYPRIVVGVDEEPNFENSLLLNLKNKIYLGFNEKAEIIEAISYNEELGRYEYQVVSNYAQGKTFDVIYANRSLCLSCHQNQTPIFSRGPWSESNANPVMAQRLQKVFDQTFGKVQCSQAKNPIYCYQDQNPMYFGAPIQIETNVTRQFDTSTDLANFMHAYQKMWKEFCVNDSCRLEHLQSMLLYRLTNQEGIRNSKNVKAEVEKLEQNWILRFPWGLGIPSPDIPDRDPFKDVEAEPKITDLSMVTHSSRMKVQELLSFSKIPAAFEPLMPRPPIGVWKDTDVDGSGTNRLIRGLATEFTSSDIRMIDQWLKSLRTEKDLITTLTSVCEIKKESSTLNLVCKGNSDESFNIELSVDLSRSQVPFDIAEISFKSATLGCKAQGDFFCPNLYEVVGTYSKQNDSQGTVTLRFKNGLLLKNSEAFEMSQMEIDLETKVAKLKIYDVVPHLSQFLQENISKTFPSTVFNRFQIMKTINSANTSQKISRIQNEVSQDLPLHVDASYSTEELEQSMNGFSVMKNVCTQCHQSNGNAPPHFMGTLTQPLSDFEMCRQIEQCAPRMLYRLKMRQCNSKDGQKKITAMPPAQFFKDEAAVQHWMNVYNPKVVKYLSSLIDEDKLAKSISGSGFSTKLSQSAVKDLVMADCPSADANFYNQLPICENKKIKPYTTKTRCH